MSSGCEAVGSDSVMAWDSAVESDYSAVESDYSAVAPDSAVVPGCPETAPVRVTKGLVATHRLRESWHNTQERPVVRASYIS